MDVIESHPLPHFLPVKAKVLMLGSFPPSNARWSIDFFYPNFQNDMWRIFGLIFFGDREYFIRLGVKAFDEKKIKEFLDRQCIALSDTAREVIREKGNASDKHLQVITPIDIETVLKQIPDCRTIVTTGQKATDILKGLLNIEEPEVGGYTIFNHQDREMRFYRMPSSSRAYPKPLEEKAYIYKVMFKEIGMINY